MHSRVCSTILDDWRNIWEIDISASDRVVRIICNENIKFHTFQKQTVGQSLLAAVRSKGEIAVLYTVANRQTSPLCSVCVTRKCPHVFFYTKEKEKEDPQFSSRVRGTPDLSDADVSDSGSISDSDTNNMGAEKGKHENYWVITSNTRLIYYNVTAFKVISFWLYCHFKCFLFLFF
jgi:hypothetical protein